MNRLRVELDLALKEIEKLYRETNPLAWAGRDAIDVIAGTVKEIRA